MIDRSRYERSRDQNPAIGGYALYADLLEELRGLVASLDQVVPRVRAEEPPLEPESPLTAQSMYEPRPWGCSGSLLRYRDMWADNYGIVTNSASEKAEEPDHGVYDGEVVVEHAETLMGTREGALDQSVDVAQWMRQDEVRVEQTGCPDIICGDVDRRPSGGRSDQEEASSEPEAVDRESPTSDLGLDHVDGEGTERIGDDEGSEYVEASQVSKPKDETDAKPAPVQGDKADVGLQPKQGDGPDARPDEKREAPSEASADAEAEAQSDVGLDREPYEGEGGDAAMGVESGTAYQSAVTRAKDGPTERAESTLIEKRQSPVSGQPTRQPSDGSRIVWAAFPKPLKRR